MLHDAIHSGRARRFIRALTPLPQLDSEHWAAPFFTATPPTIRAVIEYTDESRSPTRHSTTELGNDQLTQPRRTS
jgi:hypothetical protein